MTEESERPPRATANDAATPPATGSTGRDPPRDAAAKEGVAHAEATNRKRRRRRRGKKRGRTFTSAATRNAAENRQPSADAAAKQTAAAPAAAPPVAKPPLDRSRGEPARPTRPSRAPAGPGRRTERSVYAALDLGTNNCRLLVAVPAERGFRVVDAFSRIIRLGEGVSSSGRLGGQAMDRAVEALGVCAQKMVHRNVTRARLIATEACRAAGNSEEFLVRVAAETGLELEIVDRETEARLAVAGCTSLVDPQSSGVILFDIGGGSSELVWLDFRERRFRADRPLTSYIRAWASLPIGVVGLSERHGGVDVTPESFEAMVADVRRELAAFPDRAALVEALRGRQVHMLGTSGTVTTLAGVHLGLERYDRRRVDGLWMTGAEVTAMIGQLVAMSYDERVASPCVGAERADLVLAGCAILEAVRRDWPCDRLRVADRGLREGILTELMTEDGVWRRRRPRRGQRNLSRGQGDNG